MNLSNKFYSRKAIEKARDDFQEICDVKIKDDSFCLEITKKKDIAGLEKEFCNYVLGLMNSK